MKVFNVYVYVYMRDGGDGNGDGGGGGMFMDAHYTIADLVIFFWVAFSMFMCIYNIHVL